MADEDEEWTGPVREATPDLDHRVEALETGVPSFKEVPAESTVEERIARLERIADYLHKSRVEAESLVTSVDKLAEAAKTLVAILTTVEAQTARIESLGDRVNATETIVTRRAWVVGTILALLFIIVGGEILVFRYSTDEGTVGRCEARNEQSEILSGLLSGVLVGADENPRTDAIREALARFESLIVDCDDVQ